jgi:hypothetical protein
MEQMLVTRITGPAFNIIVPEHWFTQEQLMNEFHYILAEQAARMMLGTGLITPDEFTRIMAENRLIFSPFLAAIL